MQTEIIKYSVFNNTKYFKIFGLYNLLKILFYKYFY